VRVSRKEGFPRRQAEILAARQVFPLEQGVQDADQTADQALRVLLVEFTLFLLETGQENGQERCQPWVLSEKWVHVALRSLSPGEIIFATRRKVNLKLLF
jgi:hypothetical protein